MNQIPFLPALAVALSFFGIVSIAEGAEPKSAGADYQLVKTTDTFTVGGIGFAGTLSQQEKAFRRLLEQPAPIEQCKKLLSEAELPGQLYGLLGLRLLDPKAFAASLPRYKASRLEVRTMRGCVVMQVAAAKVAGEIEKGDLK